MKLKKNRGIAQKTLDAVFFPVRALFIPEKRTIGLTSLRDERMDVVAQQATGRVLDIGCGPGNRFVSN